MAKWSLKNRNNDTTGKVPQMPPELSDYYNAEKRDRRWATWLLGFATLIVTVLLAVLLFMGSRWIYRQIKNDDSSTPVITQNEPTENNDNDSGKSSDDNSSDKDHGPSIAGNTDNNSEPEGVVTDEAAVTDSPLPDTGPGDLIAIFLAVSLLATLLHGQFLRQKSQ